MTDQPRSPKVKLATLWERRTKDGRTYFSGFLGGCRLLVFKDDRAPVPEGAVAIWNVMLEEAPPKQRPAAEPTRSPPPRPRQPAPGQGGQRVSFRQKRPAEPIAAGPVFNDDVPF